MTDGPSDMEIDAYIDGELDVEGRFAVEDYLRRHPEKAAAVLGDMGDAARCNSSRVAGSRCRRI